MGPVNRGVKDGLYFAATTNIASGDTTKTHNEGLCVLDSYNSEVGRASDADQISDLSAQNRHDRTFTPLRRRSAR